MSNQESFRISASLKDLIGKELITDEFVAVFELVKNSFDANATEVKLLFENITDPESARLLIVDNGKGMNYKDLKKKWLFVAYSAKKLGKENDDYRDKIKTERVFAGAKGVGRFSCDRLGNRLALYSSKDEINSKIESLDINWDDFENVDEEEFINVKFKHEVLQQTEILKSNGTALEIKGLRDRWDRDKILNLKRSLVKLINPNQENDSTNFSIEIIAKEELPIDKSLNKKGVKRNDWEKVNGEIKNTIFETLEIKTTNILVEVSEDGSMIETTLQDRGDIIYFLKEKNSYGLLANIKVYLFQLNRRAKVNFSRIMGMPPVEYGSVFMYKNGFRIYPFGEEGEDLLLIDRRKQQGYNRFFGTRDLIGRIEINGKQEELRETTSRDGGLVKNDSYFELIDFFYDSVLKRLENYAINIIQWGDERILKETGEVRPELWPKDVRMQILEMITGFINSENIIDVQYNEDFLEIISGKQDKSVDKIIKNISKAADKAGSPKIKEEAKKIEDAVKKVREDAIVAEGLANQEKQRREETEKKLGYVIGQNNFLQNDVSNDTKNLESILHHIGITTDLIRRDIKNLVTASKTDVLNNNTAEIIKRISLQNEKITSFANYFKKVQFDAHDNNIRTDIVAFINEYLQNVYMKREDLKENRELLNVIFRQEKAIKFTRKINPIELIIVIDNLINNSLKYKAKNIWIHWEKEDEKKILFSYIDDGTGIKDSIIENIFDFGFTTSRRGSGLGLFHVREIVEKLGGEILVNNKLKTGVEFIISINK